MPHNDDEEQGDQWSAERQPQAVPAGGPPPAPPAASRAPSHRRRLRSRRPRQRQTARQVGGSTGDKIALAAALGFGGYMVYYLYKSSEGGYGGSKSGNSNSNSNSGSGGGTEAVGKAVVPMSHNEPENLAAEAADGAKERWDNMSAAPEEVSRFLDEDVLDIKVVTSFDMEPRNFILVTGTGGPHIEVDVGAEEISVFWGGDQATRRINNPNGLMEAIDDRLAETWRSIAG